MSGFAGIVSCDGAPPDARLLERMAERLAFRGPDATQIWCSGGAGFCFTLLRTGPAPQASEQPCTLDGRVWLLGDVRLDARDDLIRRLQQSGEELPPHVTDEELILRAWRVRGEASFEELLGDYAFALWDAEARKLWCVRDLMGIRPFYYAKVGERFYFSNTLQVLRMAPDVSAALDPEFIGDFLLQDFCANPARSAFREISRLTSGYVLRYSKDGVDVRPYTSLPIEEPLWLKRPGEYIERFQAVLEAAVSDRLPRGPAAILMSGGLDSTSIAAVANKIAQGRGTPGTLRAYTVDYTPLFEDVEGHFASVAAEHIGIPVEIFSGAECKPYEGWQEMGPLMAEPSHEPFMLLNQEQYRRVQKHTRVALGGLGGDDLLTGQAWPYLTYLFRRWRFGKIAASFGGYFLKHGRIPPLLGGFRTRFRKLVKRPDPMANYPLWLEPEFEKRLRLKERWSELQSPYKSSHPLHPRGHAGHSTRLWSCIFEPEDSAATGALVELRSPFLDQRILRYLLRVPPVPWCAHKALLRQAMRGLLPEEIRLRPKTPLLADTLRIQLDRGGWRPVPPSEPAVEMREFVNWERLRATLANAGGSRLWTDLRGVSLNYWLERR
ncbi:MAG: asparagine synthetase B family protein [Candidatus Acidiferrum sp.]